MQMLPFSLNCVICFERFDNDARRPVVLPCGHTYLCAECSKRIKKCYECRKSLFLDVEPSPKQSSLSSPAMSFPHSPSAAAAYRRQSRSPYHSRRTGYSSYGFSSNATHAIRRPSYPSPAVRVTKTHAIRSVPLPLPPNTVLLSLMEHVGFREQALLIDDESSSSVVVVVGAETPPDRVKPEELDETSLLEEGVKDIIGTSGTYVVANDSGTFYLPNDDFREEPLSSRDIWKALNGPLLEEEASQDSDSEAKPKLCRNIWRTATRTSPVLSVPVDKTQSEEPTQTQRKLDQHEDKPKKYDRIQVSEVDVATGRYKMPRGGGYVSISSHSDVRKIGIPTDTACTIEAMLSRTSRQTRHVESRLWDLEREEARLNQELLRVLSTTSPNTTTPISASEDRMVTPRAQTPLSSQNNTVTTTPSPCNFLNDINGEIEHTHEEFLSMTPTHHPRPHLKPVMSEPKLHDESLPPPPPQDSLLKSNSAHNLFCERRPTSPSTRERRGLRSLKNLLPIKSTTGSVGFGCGSFVKFHRKPVEKL